MKINLEGYDITGTPAEILELLDLLGKEIEAFEGAPAAVVETPEAPAPKKPTGKKVDWAKAKALRDAGWSYKAIGEELHVSDVTVRAHLIK